MAFNPKDHYFKKAKKENFAARSVYKLDEIDQRCHVLRNGDRVLDLGASPGSWSQYASKKVGPTGHILGIDLTEVKIKLPNAEFLHGNALEVDWDQILTERGWTDGFDLVMSDMAPRTTGIRMTDQARSFELCEWALDLGLKLLRPRGHFICKLFHSDEFQILKKRITENFEKFEAIKPHSTRTQSKEIFLVGLRRKK